MTIDEAIRILRQHNQTGASVMRITKSRATEMELLAQVLNRCEQNEVELKEAKRLLRLAVEDITFILSYACSDEEMCCEECPTVNHACNKWRYADEALKLIGGEADENGA